MDKSKHSADTNTKHSRPDFDYREFYPLSLAQQQIWVAQSAAGSTPIYNLLATYHIHGKIDIGLFQLACDRVVRGSDVLQTVFIQRSPTDVVQVRDKTLVADCKLDSLRADENIEAWSMRQGRISLDLTQCCFRFRLLQLADDTCAFYFSIHHLIADGGVLQLLWQDIENHYEALLSNSNQLVGTKSPNTLVCNTNASPSKTVSETTSEKQPLYREHVDKQLLQLDSPDRHARLNYWHEKAAHNFKPAGIYGLTNKPGYDINRIYWEMDTQSLNSLSAALEHPVFNANNTLRKNKTLFILIATALLITTSKCQSSNHQRLGFPTRSRGDKEFQNALGVFISVGFLDIQIEPDETVQSLVIKVKDDLDKSMKNLDSSIQSAHITRAFTSSLNIIIAKANEFCSIPVTTVARMNGYSDSSSVFDLHLTDFSGNGQYVFMFDMAESVFSEEDQKRYIANFKYTLNQVMANPEMSVANVRLMTDKDQNDLLTLGMGKPSSSSTFNTIQQYFIATAKANADKIALISNDTRISYGELQNRVDALALHLAGIENCSGNTIAVSLDRSIACYVSVLAILQVEARFLLLDRNLPDSRLQFMLNDADAIALIRSTNNKPICNANIGIEICLDCDGFVTNSAQGLTQPAGLGDIEHSSDASNLNCDVNGAAYLMYTSGSTGEPKAVVGTHSATLNRLQWMWHQYPFTETDICVNKTALSFVDCVWELFGPLLQGVPTVILSDDDVLDVFRFVNAIQAHRISRVSLIPSLLSVVLDSDERIHEKLSHLKQVVVSGEPLSAELTQRFFRKLTQTTLLNLYGSTEVSADITYADVTAQLPSGRIPIGRPINGLQIVLLDEHMMPVPRGSIGEIGVVGKGLSAGYYKRPLLQNTKFVANPFGDGVLYKTGDLGRYRPDGQIEHCGRNDLQLKVKGQRLEATEIEHHTLMFGGIKQCSVGINNLDALYVCFAQNEDHNIDIAELEAHLHASLPSYMQPDIVIGVPTLPTLVNGKLDRDAIAALTQTAGSLNTHRFIALNDTEAALLSIWREVLGNNEIDLTADFFAIGGNSVSAMRIVVAVHQVGIPLDLADILQIGSIRQLASVADSADIKSNNVDQALQRRVQRTLDAQAKQILLAEQELEVQNPHARYQAETENEHKLLSIWQKILKSEPIDLRADFFDIGGNSISAMQIMVGAKQVGIELGLREIIDIGSIEKLAINLRFTDKQQHDVSSAGDVSGSKNTDRQISTSLKALGLNLDPDSYKWYPLSGSQRGILFHMMMFGLDQPLYGAQGRADLEGSIDQDVFKAAWQYLVDRHDAMRSIVLHEYLEEPVQVVLPHAEQNWRYIDLSNLSENQQHIEREQLASETVHKLIPIEKAPLLRVTLIKMSDRLHHFIVDFHHIMFDGWSAASLGEELALTYKALLLSTQPKFEPCGQFQQHVAAVASQDTELVKEFWRNDLQGFTQPTNISSIRAQSEFYAKGNHRLVLDTQTTASINELAMRCRVTPNTLVQAAWSIVLARRHHTEDVLYGFAVTGRSTGIQNYESAVGMFVNSLPMRVQCNGALEIKPFLQQIQNKLLSLIEYENSSLVDILQVSDLDAHAIMFDSLLVFQNVPAPWDDPDMPYQITNRHNHENSHIPLTIEVFPEDKLRVLFLYIPEYCSADFISDIALQFRDVLDTMANLGPNGLVAEIARTSQAQLAKLTTQFNATQMAYPKEQTYTDLILEQAALSPTAKAVTYEAQSLTYAQLLTKVTALSNFLASHKIGTGTLVGACVPRSLDMLITLLGISHCGATYIPIDPEYPSDRINHIVNDSGLRHLVTVSSTPISLNDSSVQTFDIDELWPTIDSTPEQTRASVSPDQLAYIIYTSGSTGLPKGVKVTHGNVTNFLKSMQQNPGMTANDKLLAVTTVSFDIAVLELYLPLICGASVDIAPQSLVYDSFALADRLLSESINYLQATPTTWRLLLAAGWNGGSQFKALVGGEALPRDLCQQLIPKTGQLWNMYGPTETTVWSTCGKVSSANSVITIGRPIGNTEILIIDKDGTPCPINKPGELCIAGDGVSNGYHNRHQLNETKFIRHPFTSNTQERVFRTGDLARWLDNGEIECLGRLDRQIKLHGHRVEPGEIETILSGIDSIQHALVQFYKSAFADRLVAYIVLDTDEQSDKQTNTQIRETESKNSIDQLLRSTLRDKLPEYMVPAAFVRLNAIPLLPNGKIDYLSLPNPFESELSEDKHASHILTDADDTELASNLPVTQTQQQLCNVFQKALRLDSISINSNFFDIGGNSLIAMQIVAACGRQDIDLRIAQLFEMGTIIKLADAIDAQSATINPLALELSNESITTTTENNKTEQPSHSEADLLRIAELLNS